MKTIIKVFSVDMIAKLVTTIITVILIREMTESAYANYSVILAIANIFNQIAISSLGKMYIVDNERLGGCDKTILLLEILLACFITVLFCIIQPTIKRNMFSVFIFMVATCIFGYARTVYQQQCRFKIYTLLEIVRVSVFAVFIIGIYIISISNLSAASVIFFQSISLGTAMIFLTEKKSKIKWHSSLEIKKTISFICEKEQLYLLLYAVLMAVLLQLDVLSLKAWSTDYNVSAYSSALKYYNMMLMLLSTVNSVLLPKISMTTNYKEIKKVYRQQDILSIVLLLGVALAIIIAPTILPAIDGGKYPDAIIVFQILSVSALLSFWGSPYNNLLIKEKKYLGICIRFLFGIIVSITGNYILIPSMGAKGTAIVALVSYGLVNISSRIQAKHIINIKIKESENERYSK